MKQKKSKKPSSNQQQKKTVFRNFEETPNKYKSKIDPINLEEQKLRFLHQGITPQFQFKTNYGNIEDISNSKKGQIRFEYISEATRILEKVRMKFGCGDQYMEEAFGPVIECEHASAVLAKYMQENSTEGMLTVSWSKDLSCSGRISWCGPCTRFNKPEARKYSLWLKNSLDNAFLREKGIKCLADHEIGTHFLRTLNDGLQPWYSDRQRFGLRGQKSQTLLETEEGLAAINTLLQANHKLLFFPAMTYYTACKAAEMSFQELYDHLELYIKDCNMRWKYVMRVKRGLQDTTDVGGYGKDQCYFSGAVEVLRNIDKIDFNLLYSGRVCVDELPRVKRLARLDCLKLPHFLRNMEEYRKQLRHIAAVNGLRPKSAKKSARLKCSSRRNSHHTSRRSTGSKNTKDDNRIGFDKNEMDISEICEVQSVPKSENCDGSRLDVDSEDLQATNEASKDIMSLDYSYSSFAPLTPSRGDAVWLPMDDHLSRSNTEDIQSVSSAKSRTGSEYKRLTYLQSPSQSSSSGYTWQSIRTPSPAVCAFNEDWESPIPYSPARWLRRRQKTSPNLLPRKRDSKEDLRELHPVSIVRF